MNVILAIDQGTTSSRTAVVSPEGEILHIAQREFAQHFPRDGWVEHEPDDIWNTVLATLRACVAWCADNARTPLAIGLTNQRETSLLWDRETGEPLHRAIVWQDRRTAARCEALKPREAEVRAKTGLVMDPYFSATKWAWMLDHVDGARSRAEAGELCAGTVDAFLLWRLTEGRTFATDATNASRTNLFDIHEQKWSAELCDLFGVPLSCLPEVRDCAADYGTASVLDTVLDTTPFGPLPVLGVAGDQHAALVGQGGFRRGDLKVTFGTGAFLLLNTGGDVVDSRSRLLGTVAYRLDGRVTYALEGAVFVAGAAVQWLRDRMGLVSTASETEVLMAAASPDSRVTVVPAFTGLGAPHWNPDARGLVTGITRATGAAELVDATVSSVALQTHDLLEAMAKDGLAPERLLIDGGMSANGAFAQRLADLCDVDVARPKVLETTALGAAYLAGLQVGLYSSLEDIPQRIDAEWSPKMDAGRRDAVLARWRKAVGLALDT